VTYPDAFALEKSGLNTFLFSGVGAELNGSSLTVLSTIARLGEDPWTEAANWAILPRAVATERLAQSIARMPLVPQALAEARATAARLVLLLPGQTKPVARAANALSGHEKEMWIPATALVLLLGAGLALNLVALGQPSHPGTTPKVAATAKLVTPPNEVGGPLTPDTPMPGG